MKGTQKITLILLAVLVLAACSRKKNTFLNRSAHSVTAEFNALYNGGVAFEQGKEELALTYRDNFWEILPVERLELTEEIIGGVPGENGNPDFNKAEEKATKAIQKHAMYIDGKEYNPQVDEAYLLLGKARYFDMRFVPALDAFNFILNRYPTSNNINKAKVWKAKTNIRLRNEEVALENLTAMIAYDDLDDEELADASAIMAQAYINLDSIPEALPFIKMASEYVRNNELKGRYAYIKGQLYNRLDQKDSANLAFDEVIALNRKSPRVYMINAYIAKARNFDYQNEDRVAFLELLKELEENRENRPFLDKIYNQIGEYYLNSNSIDTAVVYYNKSIAAFDNDRTLQAVNYQTLGGINFDKAEYKIAGAYYDSTLSNLNENTRPWRRIKKKRDNLDDVIKYEDIATLNDSILRIANMSEAQQLAFFTTYTNKLKEKAIADSISKIEAEETIANNEFYKKNVGEKGEEKNAGNSNFYFYNSATVAYGKQEFKKIWGNRKLEDYWRISSKQQSLESLEDLVAGGPIPLDELFKPETYLARIPTEPKAVDSITQERNFAYYQLGLIYKEKFKEYGLATNRLEKLLSFSPEERLVLPAKYNLYKIYTQIENTGLATQYKNDIINNHPDSRYAEILRNPEAMLASDESSPEYKYKELYAKFEASKYQEVLDTCDDYINIYNGNDIVPKLELLKATTIGRQQGFEPYKKALNFVSLNYPNSEEGKQAQEMYTTVLPTLADKSFYADEQSDHWKVIYRFEPSNREAAEVLKEKLEKAIELYRSTSMSASIDYYTPETVFVVLHGFNTRLGGRNFATVLKENENNEYRIEKASFEISSPNYEIVQIHKNLEEYFTADLSKKRGEKPVNTKVIDKKREAKTKADIKAKERIRNEASVRGPGGTRVRPGSNNSGATRTNPKGGNPKGGGRTNSGGGSKGESPKG